MRPFLILYCFLIGPGMLGAQSLGEKLKSHQGQYQLEKVYVSHDRPYYAPGDTIWGQVYLVDGRSHLRVAQEPIVHLDWFNERGDCLRSMLLKIREGTASFDIPTQPADSIGFYVLRAFTQYQRNFDPAYLFQKSILLTKGGIQSHPLDEEKPDFFLHFFPEGGYLVNGCSGKVAFLATDDQGQPVEVSGILQSKSDSALAAISAVHQGMGVFSITPRPGEVYTVRCTYQGKEKTFPLPAPLREGYQLSVGNREQDFFEFQIQGSPGQSVEGLHLVGHIRGQVFLDEQIPAGSYFGKRIPRNALPSGLVHLSLFDQQKRPIAERLLFNRNVEQDVQVSILKQESPFNLRDKIDLKLQVLRNGAPLSAKLSLSVYNSGLVTAQKEAGNIQNYLWLQSDLQELIPNIHQYLHDNTSSTRILLDYVLMTRGWRRFNWQEVLTEEPQILYPSQENIVIAGKVTKGRKKSPIEADVFLNVLSIEQFTALNLTTKQDGLFYFKGFEFTDSTKMVIQANEYQPKKQKKRKKGEAKRVGNTNVNLEIIDLNNLPFRPVVPEIPQIDEQTQQAYAQAVENSIAVKQSYQNLITQDIAEMEVSASRLSPRQIQERELRVAYRERGIPYSPTSKKLFMDNMANLGQNFPDIYELIGSYFPGVIIDRTEPTNKKVFLSNVNVRLTQDALPAILVLDGMVVDQSAHSFLPPIFPIDVKSIDVYSPIQASIIFGNQAIGGAVVIITRDEPALIGDQTESFNNGTITITHPGYYSARTFFSPDYGVLPEETTKPDLRTTLFWLPRLDLNNQAEAITFHTGDQAGTFTLQIEGISTDGVPFVHWEEIHVKRR